MQVWCTVLLQPGKPRDKRNLPRTSWRRCQDCPRTRVLLEVFRTCAVHITGPIFSCHLCRRVPLSIFESCTSLCQAIWLHKSIQQPQEVVLRRFFKKMSHSIPNLYKPLAASLVHFLPQPAGSHQTFCCPAATWWAQHFPSSCPKLSENYVAASLDAVLWVVDNKYGRGMTWQNYSSTNYYSSKSI